MEFETVNYTLFYKNIFYKNKPEAEILKRI